jgi:hypothetical protein
VGLYKVTVRLSNNLYDTITNVSDAAEKWEFKFTYDAGHSPSESAWCAINEQEIDWTTHPSLPAIKKVSFRRAR